MRGAGQAPHLPLPEIAGSPHGTEQGWAQLSVLLGTQLHIRRVPRFIDENTEVQRKEDLVFRDRGCGWRGVPAAFPGAHKALLGKVLSPLSGFIHPLVQPPCPPCFSGAHRAAPASAPLRSLYLVPGSPFPTWTMRAEAWPPQGSARASSSERVSLPSPSSLHATLPVPLPSPVSLPHGAYPRLMRWGAHPLHSGELRFARAVKSAVS